MRFARRRRIRGGVRSGSAAALSINVSALVQSGRGARRAFATEDRLAGVDIVWSPSAPTSVRWHGSMTVSAAAGVRRPTPVGPDRAARRRTRWFRHHRVRGVKVCVAEGLRARAGRRLIRSVRRCAGRTPARPRHAAAASCAQCACASGVLARVSPAIGERSRAILRERRGARVVERFSARRSSPRTTRAGHGIGKREQLPSRCSKRRVRRVLPVDIVALLCNDPRAYAIERPAAPA